MSSYLPQGPGLLPTWLFINAILSFLNTINCFFIPSQAKTMYLGANSREFTGLSRRTFGCWTILSGFVRFYAAYHITNPEVYALAFWAYVAIAIHWVTEFFVFRTVGWGATIAVSLVIDCGAPVWMLLQWGAYVGSV